MVRLGGWLAGALVVLAPGCGRVAPGTSTLARPAAPNYLIAGPCTYCGAGTSTPGAAETPKPACGLKQYDESGHVVYQMGDPNCR